MICWSADVSVDHPMFQHASLTSIRCREYFCFKMCSATNLPGYSTRNRYEICKLAWNFLLFSIYDDSPKPVSTDLMVSSWSKGKHAAYFITLLSFTPRAIPAVFRWDLRVVVRRRLAHVLSPCRSATAVCPRGGTVTTCAHLGSLY